MEYKVSIIACSDGDGGSRNVTPRGYGPLRANPEERNALFERFVEEKRPESGIYVVMLHTGSAAAATVFRVMPPVLPSFEVVT